MNKNKIILKEVKIRKEQKQNILILKIRYNTDKTKCIKKKKQDLK